MLKMFQLKGNNGMSSFILKSKHLITTTNAFFSLLLQNMAYSWGLTPLCLFVDVFLPEWD